MGPFLVCEILALTLIENPKIFRESKQIAD